MWSDKFDTKDFRKCIDDYTLDELEFLYNFFDDELYIIQMTFNCCQVIYNRDQLDMQRELCLDYRDFIKEKITLKKENKND